MTIKQRRPRNFRNNPIPAVGAFSMMVALSTAIPAESSCGDSRGNSNSNR
jgi:hypothetical protein